MRRIYFPIIALVALALGSCSDYLDKQPDDQLTMDMVFSNRVNTESFLYNVYSYMPEEWDQHDNNPWNGACDEADYVYRRDVDKMNDGSWEPSSVPYNKWNHYYQGIRAATFFMQNVDKCTELNAPIIAQYKAEARFLRATYYFFLVRQYGPVVILGDEVLPFDGSVDLNKPRSPYDECVDYIVKEFDEIASQLPITQPSESYGKPTKGAALAYKSRMLLYAASPLFNGNPDYAGYSNGAGKNLFNNTYDKNKWKKAADASKAVIDMNAYALVDNGNPYDSYKSVFIDNWNSEIIFGRIYGGDHWDRHCLPRGLQGYGGIASTQAQVDAYAMSNGKYPITGYADNGKTPIIDPSSGYSETDFSQVTLPSAKSSWTENTYNMWANREPRFYASVLWGGERWIFTEQGGQPYYVQFYTNGKDGPSSTAHDYPKSGYMITKLSHPENDLQNDVCKIRSWIMFRLAEVYLNYAEALNEYEPGNVDILKYVNMIRKRAGVPNLETVYPAVKTDQTLMREMIRRERRVELAFECQRYFDVHRWKIAEVVDNTPAYGMDISQTDYNANYYKRTKFENRVFLKKHYLFPIAQSELELNKALVQNPLW